MYIGFFDASKRNYSSEYHSQRTPSMFAKVSCNYGSQVLPIVDRNSVVILFKSVTQVMEYCIAHNLDFATTTTVQTLADSIEHGASYQIMN